VRKIEKRISLSEISDHEFFQTPYPPLMPISTLICPPSISYSESLKTSIPLLCTPHDVHKLGMHQDGEHIYCKNSRLDQQTPDIPKLDKVHSKYIYPIPPSAPLSEQNTNTLELVESDEFTSKNLDYYASNYGASKEKSKAYLINIMV
jgi:hypothetical protein